MAVVVMDVPVGVLVHTTELAAAMAAMEVAVVKAMGS